MTNEAIKSAVAEIYEELLDIRTHIHAHPELSFQEEETSSFIKARLDDWGISYTDNWATHGIVAEINGEQSGKTIGLRADMDALPILEENKVSYCSKNKGVMHACGHDVHTTCLLGALKILQENRDLISGKIVGIFQPGEEKLPGGASILIKEGLLEKYTLDHIFCLHVHPPMLVGEVGVREGMYMASADEVYIDIIGKGGHAALPHNSVDTVLMASRVVNALQDVVARNGNPIIPSVLTFGKINSEGGATNVIPDRVSLCGTFRTMDEAWRMEAHEAIRRIAEHTCASMGGTCKVNVMKGYPYLHNDENTTSIAREALIDLHGRSHVKELPIRMTAEDFAYYSQEVPASLIRLGTNNENDEYKSPVHTTTFDIDPRAIKTGVETLVKIYISMA